jgi:cytochrome c-type biogenesis protein CcsB
MSRFGVEVALQWCAVGCYALATGLFAGSIILGRPRRLGWAAGAGAVGLVPHGAALVSRWVASGHGPYMLRTEVLSSDAWVVIAATLVVVWRRPRWAMVALVAMPLAILAVALGLASNPELRDLPPTLRSVWLVFHIVFAKISVAAFLLSFASAALCLHRAQRPSAGWTMRFPATDALEALAVRFAAFGFFFWTITIAAGAIWAHQSWGRYWGWDPIETWSLVAWLVYGSFLHARLFWKLGPKATAWSAVGAFVVLLLAALIVPFLVPSIHAAYFQ